MRSLVVSILSLSLCHSAYAQKALAANTASNQTTAWHNGKFHVDVAGVMSRSDIVLGRANTDAGEALPLSFVPVTGVQAVTAKRFGKVQIGLFAPSLLSGADVRGKDVRGSVVTLGASITEGAGSTPGTNRDWPSVLAARLKEGGLHIAVINKGISGNRLLVDGAGSSALSRFDRDVLSQPGVHWVIFSDDPINDLGSTRPAPTADELIAGIQRLIARAHGRHIQFFCSTLTPYEGANYWTPSGEAARERVNIFLRSKKSGCDAVIDQDAVTHDPAHRTRYLPAYDSGDHLHPNDAGHRAIANGIDLSLFSHRDQERKSLVSLP